MKRELANYTDTYVTVEGGKFVRKTRVWEVRVMARADGYAMVRRKGGAPFVAREKDLAVCAPVSQPQMEKEPR